MCLKVSVICTLLNEGASIHKLLDSLVQQTRWPDEIIFVDGGSADDTVSVLEGFAAEQDMPVQIIVAPGANISQGRNIGIEVAAGSIIASTDAGVRLDQNWLYELLKPFQNDPKPAVVSGFFVSDPQSAFELAMGATVLPLVSDIDPDSFLPSSRSIAFLKSSWQAAGRYPEWLDYCEDLIFDFRLREAVGPFIFTPAATVYFRPRASLKTFFKQYFQYARGDGKADLWRKRHLVRYLTYLAALPLMALLGAIVSPWWWLLGAILAILGMFYKPYQRLFLLWIPFSTYEKLAAICWIPIIRVTGDIAKMSGYPLGWKWRLERLSTQPELRWRHDEGRQSESDG
jgi:glycosyltransferase involved in cell wall biosynthesis